MPDKEYNGPDLGFMVPEGNKPGKEYTGPDLSFMAPRPTEAAKNIELAKDLDPVAEARRVELAKKAGVPVDLAREAEADILQRVEAPDPDSLPPKTSEFYGAKVENAAAAKNDHEKLSLIERTVNSFKKLPLAAEVGVENVKKGKLYNRQMWNAIRGLEDSNLDIEIEVMESTATPSPVDENVFERAGTAAAEQLPLLWDMLVGGQKRGLETGLVFGLGALALGQAGPQVAAPEEVITVPAATALGYGVGVKLGASENIFIQESGHAWAEFAALKDENGVRIDPKVAAAASVVVGGVNSGLEFFSLKMLARTIPGGEKLIGNITTQQVKKALMNPSVRRALAGVAAKYAGAITTEGLTEMFQESANVIGAELAKNVSEVTQGTEFEDADLWSEVPRILEAGVEGALATAVIGAAGTSISTVQKIQGVRDSQAFIERHDEINKAINDTEIKQNSPILTEEYLDMVGVGEEVYLTPEGVEALQQAAGGVEVMKRLGIDSDIAQKSIETGQDVVLKMSALHARLTPEEFNNVKQDIKPSPSALSTREAEGIDIGEEVKKLAERHADIIKSEEPFQTEVKRIEEEVSATGAPKEYVAQYSNLLQRYANRMALEGKDRVDFLKRIQIKSGVTFQDFKARQAQRVGPTLEQAANITRQGENFKKRFEGSQVIDEQGNPMVVYRGQIGDLEGISTRLSSPTFSPHSFIASDYAEDAFQFNEETGELELTTGTRVYPVYLDIKNPLRMNVDEDVVTFGMLKEMLSPEGDVQQGKFNTVVDEAGFWRGKDRNGFNLDPADGLWDSDYVDTFRIVDNPAFIELLKLKGYDGVIYRGPHTGRELSATPEEQIEFERIELDGALEYRPVSEDQIIPIYDSQVFNQMSPFDRWTQGAEVVDDAQSFRFKEGQPYVVKTYHGTTHEFEVPDPRGGNPENHFGRGFYTSSSEEDVEANYLADGADLTVRIEKTAENLIDDMHTAMEEGGPQAVADEFFNGSIDRVREFLVRHNAFSPVEEGDTTSEGMGNAISEMAMHVARNRVAGPVTDGQVLEVFVKMMNPMILDPIRGTQIYTEIDMEYYTELAADEINKEDYTDEDGEFDEGAYEDDLQDRALEIYSEDYSPAEEGNGPKLFEAIQKAAYDFEEVDSASLADALRENFDNFRDGVNAQEVFDFMRTHESVVYASDPETGDLSSGEFLRQVIEYMGYDGIIMDAEHPGWNLDIPYGTRHFISWQRGSVKSADKNSGDYSLVNPSMYYQRPGRAVTETLNLDPRLTLLTDINSQIRNNTPLDEAWFQADKATALELISETENDNPGQPRAIYRVASLKAKERGPEGVMQYNRGYPTRDSKTGAMISGLHFFSSYRATVQYAREKYGPNYIEKAEIQALPLAYLPDRVAVKNVTPRGDLNMVQITIPGDLRLDSLEIHPLTELVKTGTFEIRRNIYDTSNREQDPRTGSLQDFAGDPGERGLPGFETRGAEAGQKASGEYRRSRSTRPLRLGELVHEAPDGTLTPGAWTPDAVPGSTRLATEQDVERYQTYFQSAPIWYSNLQRLVSSDKFPAKGTGASYINILQSWVRKGLIKEEELEWSGVKDLLEGSIKTQLTRHTIADHLTELSGKLGEVLLGPPPERKGPPMTESERASLVAEDARLEGELERLKERYETEVRSRKDESVLLGKWLAEGGADRPLYLRGTREFLDYFDGLKEKDRRDGIWFEDSFRLKDFLKSIPKQFHSLIEDDYKINREILERRVRRSEIEDLLEAPPQNRAVEYDDENIYHLSEWQEADWFDDSWFEENGYDEDYGLQYLDAYNDGDSVTFYFLARTKPFTNERAEEIRSEIMHDFENLLEDGDFSEDKYSGDFNFDEFTPDKVDDAITDFLADPDAEGIQGFLEEAYGGSLGWAYNEITAPHEYELLDEHMSHVRSYEYEEDALSEGLVWAEDGVASLNEDVSPGTGGVKFRSWMFSGGVNYRELLITANFGGQESPFSSSHFSATKNIAAHVLFDERVDSEGNNVLFIHELQSDWHQMGRERGYLNRQLLKEREDLGLESGQIEVEIEELSEDTVDLLTIYSGKSADKFIPLLTKSSDDISFRRKTALAEEVLQSNPGMIRSMMTEAGANPKDIEKVLANAQLMKDLISEKAEKDKRIGEIQTNFRESNAVPDGPYKKTWPLLGLKRMVRWAAENGFDKIAWSTGKHNASRYNLRKHIGEVRYQQQGSGYAVNAYTPSGATAFSEGHSTEDGIDIQRLEEVFGKEIAHRIALGVEQIDKAAEEGAIKSAVELRDKEVERLKNYLPPYAQLIKVMRGVETQWSWEVGVDPDVKNIGEFEAEIMRKHGLNDITDLPGVLTPEEAAERSRLLQNQRGINNTHFGFTRNNPVGALIDFFSANKTFLEEDRAGVGSPQFNVAISDADAAQTALNVLVHKKGTGTLKGVDLETGGEGMIGFYDQILPSTFNKFFGKKAWGNPKVETTQIADLAVVEQSPGAGKYNVAVNYANNTWAEGYNSDKEARTVHSVTLTPQMKAGIPAEGLPLFQQEQDPRGLLEIRGDKYIISLFERADLSTLLHETGHVFYEEMSSIVKTGAASKQLLDDFEVIRKWVGAEPGAKLNEEQKEKFARGFEAYLMEGVAPSRDLETAFSRFRKWLTNVYVTVKNLNADLNDDVRRAFDRLLSADQEIQATAAANDMRVLSRQEMDALGVSSEDRGYMERLIVEALEAAERRMVKDRNKDIRKLTANWREEIKNEINEMQVYKTLKALVEKEGLDKDQLVAAYGAEILERLPKTAVKEDGLDLDWAAYSFEYADADAMIKDITSAMKRQELLEARLDLRILQHDQQYRAEDYLTDTKEYGEYMFIKSRYLERKGGRPRAAQPTQVFKTLAKQTLGGMEVRQAVRHDRFMAALRKYSAVERDKIRKNKMADASAANEKARLNYEMASQAVKNRKEVERIIKKAKRAAKSKTISEQYKENILALIERFGLGTANMKPQNIEDKTPLAQLLNQEDEILDLAGYFSDFILNESISKDYRDLTMDEMVEVGQAIDFLTGRGRDMHTAMLADKSMSIEQAANKIAAEVSTLPKKKVYEKMGVLRKVTDAARSYFAMMDSLNFIAVALGGYKNIGAKGVRSDAEKLITDRLVEAQTQKDLLNEKVYGKLEKHLQRILFSVNKLQKKYGRKIVVQGAPVPELLRKDGQDNWWTAEQIFSIALNMGNEGNIQRLFSGYEGLNTTHAAHLLDLLTKEDWEAVQGIWDTIDSLYKDLDGVHFRLNHFRMNKVEAKPVVTKYGTFRGGYYPARYNGNLVGAESRKVAQFTEADDMINRTEAMFQIPAAKSGLTKQRASRVSLPLMLTLDVATQHFRDAVQYITHAEAVRDIDRITRHPALVGPAQEVLGKQVYDMIRPALQYIARPQRDYISQDKVGKAVEYLRGYTTPFILAWNTGVAIKQWFSTPSSWFEMGFGAWLNGFADVFFTGSPISQLEKMKEMSPYIRQRTQSMDRELHDMFKKMDPEQKVAYFGDKSVTWEDVRNFGFWQIRVMDMFAVMPIWQGAFNKAVKENGGDMDAAIRYADEIVRKTQPSAQPLDLSRWQTVGGATRLLSMFQTFTVGKYGQRQRLHYRAYRAGKITHGEYAWFNFCDAILPAFGMSILFAWIWGDDLDDKETWQKIGVDMLKYTFLTGLPLISDFFSPYGNPGDSAVGTVFEQIKRTGKTAIDFVDDYSDETKAKVMWQLFRLASLFSKVPASQVADKVVKGAEQDTESPIKYLVPAPKNRR